MSSITIIGYAKFGRRSIPPEKLLRALLLQVLHTVRSERMLMEQLEYNMLFRWLVGLNLDEPVFRRTLRQRRMPVSGGVKGSHSRRVNRVPSSYDR